MSNYRVRQILALRLPDPQNKFMTALGTHLRDDSRTVRVAYSKLIAESGLAPNTAKLARQKLESSGRLESRRTGYGRGHVIEWTAWCLPGSSPEVESDQAESDKGVNNADPLTSGKGVNWPLERGAIAASEGGQPPLTGQRKPDHGLELRANSSSSRGVAALVRQRFPDATDTEIESIVSDRKAKPVRSVLAVVDHELKQGTLQLPCDPDGPGRHTEACRSGNSGRCRFDWCACRCHVRPVDGQDARRVPS